MADLAENFSNDAAPAGVTEIRPMKRQKHPWLNQLLAILAATGSAVAWAFSISGDMREAQQRLAALEAQGRRVEVMVLQNRVMTLEIARELAKKMDEALPGHHEGLQGVDFAIQQAKDDLDRVGK